MGDSEMIDYAPHPLVGSVEVRSAGPGEVMITVRPTARRIVPMLIGPAVIALIGPGLLLLIVRLGGPSGWAIYIFPTFFVLAGVGSGIGNAWPRLFPITFQATADGLVMSWRKLTEVRRLWLARRDIQFIRAGRIRPRGFILKRWSLIVQRTDGGQMILFHGSPAELECMARHLRAALALREPCEEAMRIPMPLGCRYQRMVWGEGIAVFIPPRGEKETMVGLTALSGGLAAGCFGMIRHITSDPMAFPGSWGRTASAMALSLIAGLIAWLAIYNLLRQARRRTGITASPRGVGVAESGLLRPLNVQWKSDQMKEIVVGPTTGGGNCLRVTPIGGHPLELALGEKAEHLAWMCAVLNSARSSGMHAGEAAISPNGGSAGQSGAGCVGDAGAGDGGETGN